MSEYTNIILQAENAGRLEITTGVTKVSNETRDLCAAFMAHYWLKGVRADIQISGPETADHYAGVTEIIGICAASINEPRDWTAIAKLAGEHGIRYPTNASPDAFLKGLGR